MFWASLAHQHSAQLHKTYAANEARNM